MHGNHQPVEHQNELGSTAHLEATNVHLVHALSLRSIVVLLKYLLAVYAVSRMTVHAKADCHLKRLCRCSQEAI